MKRDVNAWTEELEQLRLGIREGHCAQVETRIDELARLVRKRNATCQRYLRHPQPNPSLAAVEASLNGISAELRALKLRSRRAQRLRTVGDQIDAELKKSSEAALARSWQLLRSSGPAPRSRDVIYVDHAVPAQRLLLQRLRLAGPVTSVQAKALTSALGNGFAVPVRHELTADAAHHPRCTVLLDGLVGRLRTLSDGRQQITRLHLPGDIVDLDRLVMGQCQDTLIALSRCRLADLDIGKLRAAIAEHPALLRILWATTAADAAGTMAWLGALGQLTARGQAAHLFCSTYLRLAAMGLAKDHQLQFPVTIADYGDLMGLSTVHANRALSALREEALIAMDGPLVRILDWQRLQEAAKFDPGYLQVRRSY